MSILAFGTSLAAFMGSAVSTNFTAETTAAKIAPQCAEGVAVSFNDTAGLPLNFTASADIWGSFYLYNNVSFDISAFVATISGGGTDLFRIDCVNSTTNMFRIEYWNGSAWVAGTTAAGSVATNVRARFDYHIKIDDSAGALELYLDGTLIGSFSGDTLHTAQATVDRVVHKALVNGSNTSVLSGMFIADEDTRAITYIHRPPNAAGANSDWTGAYTTVDETGIDDTDLMQSGTANQVSTFDFAALPTTFNTGYDVVGVGVVARARKGATGPQHIQLATRHGSTNGFSADKNLSSGFGPVEHVFHQNPATAAAWTFAEADAAQIGAKSTA